MLYEVITNTGEFDLFSGKYVMTAFSDIKPGALLGENVIISVNTKFVVL